MKTALLLLLCLPLAAKAPAPKHVKAGLACSACHKEDPPAQAPKMAVCMGCHGDYATVAAATKALPVNPHDSHKDEVDCTECHHQHKPPTVMCLQCHSEYKFNAK